MSNKRPKKTNNSEDKKKKRIRAFWITFCSFIIVFGLFIMGHFLFKRCHGGGDEPKEPTYNIKVVQPEDEAWKVTVNGEDKSLNVKYGAELNVVVEPTQSNYQPQYNAIDVKNDNPAIYYASISSQKDPQTEIWTSSQLKKQDTKYVTTFNMNWTFDIVLQIKGDSDFEKFIYEKEQDEITWTYGETLYQMDKDIIRINVKTLEEDTIPRTTFDQPLWIGKKVKSLDHSFLAGCSNFNQKIDFQGDDSTIDYISDNFLYKCTSYNQPIEFPNSLTEIKGNFMFYCTSFNQPIDTNKVKYMHRNTDSSFLFACTSFNSTVTIGSALEQIPSFFLTHCTSYNKNITIPKTITHIGDGFLRNCYSMTSTITINCPVSAFDYTSENVCSADDINKPCCSLGMNFTSTHETEAAAIIAAWRTNFPDFSDTEHNIHRKLNPI